MRISDWSSDVCSSDLDADRPLQLVLDRADGLIALSMVVVRAVAEVEAEHIGAGAKELADHLLAGAGGAERGEDLRISLASPGAASTQAIGRAACRERGDKYA